MYVGFVRHVMQWRCCWWIVSNRGVGRRCMKGLMMIKGDTLLRGVGCGLRLR